MAVSTRFTFHWFAVLAVLDEMGAGPIEIELGASTCRNSFWIAAKRTVYSGDEAPAEIALSAGLLASPPPPKRHGSGLNSKFPAQLTSSPTQSAISRFS